MSSRQDLKMFFKNYTWKGRKAWHAVLSWTGKGGHNLNCSSSLSQKWLPGTNTGHTQPQSSAPATQRTSISSSFCSLTSREMMTSDLALTSSIFTILFQIPHRSEDSSDSGKKQIELSRNTVFQSHLFVTPLVFHLQQSLLDSIKEIKLLYKQ